MIHDLTLETANKPYLILQGDCVEAGQYIPENTLDSAVLDPPAGISFMGQQWDDSKGGYEQWVQWLADRLRVLYRALKPGGHALIWALPRTSHWTGRAIEESGLEVRDVITHLFGSGFPKNLNLKPGAEFWFLCRKPIDGSRVSNARLYGTGFLNIDACRIPTADPLVRPAVDRQDNSVYGKGLGNGKQTEPSGRYPANVVLSHSLLCVDGSCDDYCPVAEIDRQGGHSRSSNYTNHDPSTSTPAVNFLGNSLRKRSGGYTDAGGPSRFFQTFGYFAKASRRDRDEGLDAFPDRTKVFNGQASTSSEDMKPVEARFTTTLKNIHPTAKNTRLCDWLIGLITPSGGIVGDFFMGSGSVGVAAIRGGFRFIGVEIDPEYFEIAKARLDHATREGV